MPNTDPGEDGVNVSINVTALETTDVGPVSLNVNAIDDDVQNDGNIAATEALSYYVAVSDGERLDEVSPIENDSASPSSSVTAASEATTETESSMSEKTATASGDGGEDSPVGTQGAGVGFGVALLALFGAVLFAR